jgi:hypothetical protein
MWGNVAISHEGVCALAFGMNAAEAAIENSSIRVIAIAEVLSFCIFLFLFFGFIHVKCMLSTSTYVVYIFLQLRGQFTFDSLLYIKFRILDTIQDV